MQKNVKRLLPSLSIAIPAYNEGMNVEWVLLNTLSEAPKYLQDFEIIVIDDGSTDNTGQIADRFSRKDTRVRVVHKENGGYGEAMLRGIREAKKDYVAYMPADGQFLIADMKRCFKLMGRADLILGFRKTRTDYSFYRHILSHGYIWLLFLLFGLTFRDVNWLNIWKVDEVKKIKVASRGVFILAEIILNFRKRGLKIAEAPSYYRKRRGGKVKNAKLSIAFQTLIDAFKYRMYYE